MCTQQKAPYMPSAYLIAHPRYKTCIQEWKQHQQQRCSFWCNGEVRNSPTLITQYLWEVFQEHLLTSSLIGVWRHQLLPWKCFIQVLTGDWGLPDQLALAGLQNRNQPRGVLLKVPVRFVLQIDVDYFMAKRARETRPRQAQFCSSPLHTMVKCSHLNSSVLQGLNPLYSPVFFETACRTNPLTQKYCHSLLEKAHTDLQWAVCRLHACLLLV